MKKAQLFPACYFFAKTSPSGSGKRTLPSFIVLLLHLVLIPPFSLRAMEHPGVHPAGTVGQNGCFWFRERLFGEIRS